MTKLRVGVIGCGGIANVHIRGYLSTGRYEIVGLADLNESAMAEKDTTFNIKPNHYTDARTMLAEEKPDVVSVCTWHTGHAPWTIAAATHKPKAIISEKPMADNLGHAEQMVIACKRNGVKLAVAHQRRFIPSYVLARDLIAQGAIGKVQVIQSFATDGLPNYSTHQTDMYRFLLGDDECDWVMGNVERKTDRYERSTRIEDCAVGIFHFTGGAVATLLSDVIPLVYQGARIFGSDGMIDLTTYNLQILNRETGGAWQLHEPDGSRLSGSRRHPRRWKRGPTGSRASDPTSAARGRTASKRSRWSTRSMSRPAGTRRCCCQWRPAPTRSI
jgi:predicted dehydrogenase